MEGTWRGRWWVQGGVGGRYMEGYMEGTWRGRWRVHGGVGGGYKEG